MASLSALQAANRTWVFSPGDSLWSNGGNWGGTAPVAADVLFFGDSTITNLDNDFAAATAFNGITFNFSTNSSYVFTGNAINLAGNITDNSTNLQAINIDLNMTAARTAAVLNGGQLVIGGAIGQTAAGFGFTAAQSLGYNPNFSTVTLNSATPNTYSGGTTIGQATILNLDFSNLSSPINLISNSSALTLSGGIYKLTAKSSGSTFQTNGNLTLNSGGNGITLNPNGGAGVNLTVGNTWTRNAGATLTIDASAGGMLSANPALGNGILGYAVVKDATSTGFATTNNSGNIARYSDATTLTSTDNSAVTNFVTSGNLTTAGSFAVNSLTLDATAGSGVLDLGGAANAITNTSRAVLMVGGNNYTIQNGQLAAAGNETIVHQMGSGVLTLSGTIGNAGAALTKNGNGTLLLSGASTNNGLITINRGTVKAGVATVTGVSGALGNGLNAITVNAGGVLDLNGFNVAVGAVNNAPGLITNSGTMATLIVGNNNQTPNVNSSVFAGPLQLVINGTGWANLQPTLPFGTMNLHSGGTVLTNNGATAHRINSVAFYGTGPLTFAGVGNLQNTAAYNLTNAVVINGTGNFWNYQSTTAVNGPWTGSGLININQGFQPVFTFGGDMTGFQGTLELQANGGTGNNSPQFALSNTNTVGLAQAKVVLKENGTGSGGNVGNIFLQWAGAAALVNVNVPIGDLSSVAINNGGSPDPGATGSFTLRNQTAGTTAIFQIGSLNLSSAFGGSIIDGNGIVGLTKVGTGTLTISGTTLSYTGNTTVSNGTLVVNGPLSSSPVTVYAPGALGGNNTISGAVVLDAGNAAINLTNNSGVTLSINGGLTLNSGNILTFDLGTSSDQIALNGSGFTQSGSATIYVAPVSGFAAGTYNLISSAASTPLASSFTLGNTIPGYTMSLSNPDSSTLQLTVSAAAAATAFWHNRSGTAWNVANNWDTDASGNIALSTTPSIPTDVTFAADAATIFNTTLGADIGIHTLTLSTPNNVTIGGGNTLTISAGLTSDFSAGQNTINTKVVLATDQTWVNNSANSLILNSNVSGAHALVIKAGSTNIQLNGQNTYTGGTYIESGTLTLGNATDTLANSGAVVIDNGILALDANNDTVGAVILTNGSIIGTSGVLTGSSFELQNGTISANIAGGTVNKTSDGSIALLSGTNSYTGATTISAGTLQLGSSSAAGLSSGVSVLSGATLDLNGFNLTRPVTSIAGVGNGSGALVNNSVNPSAITTDWSNGNQSFTVGGSGDISLPSMGGTGTWTVTQDNTGTVTYGGSGDNSFMVLVVNQGTAVLAKTNLGGYHVTGGSGPGSADLVLNNGVVRIAPNSNGDQLFNNRLITVNGGLFDLNGQTEAVDGINGFGGQVTNGAVTVGTFTVGINNGSPGTFSGTIDGPVALTKAGAGTQTLGGVNAYTGATIISGGTLSLAEPASIANSSSITINANTTLDVSGRGDQTLTLTSGQTLTGGGSINGSLVAQANSIVAPGTGLGTLRVTNDITLAGKLLLEVNRTNSPNHDSLVSVLGTINYGGTLSVTNIGPALQVGDTFQLFPSAVSAFTTITLATNDATGSIYTWNNNVAANGSVSVASVTSPVNQNPTNITVAVTSNQMILSWPADHTGWKLQVQTNSLATGLSANWVTIPNSELSNSYTNTINPANGTVFFRMVYP